MAKTVVVEVSRQRPHSKYGRLMKRVTKIFAHTEKELPVGSMVVVEESKPISKLKRWRVVQVIDENKEN